MAVKQTADPKLPHSIEAERMVLGALLSNVRGAEEVFDYLEPEEFFDPRHQIIYRAMKERYERAEVIDMVLVNDALRSEDKLASVGGITYLAGLTDGMPHKLNVDPHGRMIAEKSIHRTLAHTMERIGNLALESAESAAFLIDHALESVAAIRKGIEVDDESVSYRDAGMRFLERTGKDPIPRVITGIEAVDSKTGGFKPGELVIFTAETGTGKTCLAQQVRRNACRAGHHCLYASGEMKAHHLIARELAAEARVDQWKTRKPESINERELAMLVEVVGQECKHCRILDGELSLARIRRTARAMKRKGSLGLVVVDYDELVDVPGKDEWEQQRVLTRAAKSLGMELDCPVIVISQLRKVLQGEDREHPTLQRLYGSGAKAKHSSFVLYVDRRYVQDLEGDETEAAIYILKSRDGQVGKVPAKFNIRTLRFEDDLLARPAEPERLPYRN